MKNTKYFLTVFCFVVMATTLVGCKSTSVVPPSTETIITKTITETVRDTILTIEKDSSYYRAYLECVNNKVVIKPGVISEAGAGKQVAIPKVKIQDNLLMVDCVAAAQTLFFKWKEKYTEENKASIQKVPYEVPAKFSWWQTTQLWCGRIFIALLLLVAVLIGLRFLLFQRKI